VDARRRRECRPRAGVGGRNRRGGPAHRPLAAGPPRAPGARLAPPPAATRCLARGWRTTGAGGAARVHERAGRRPGPENLKGLVPESIGAVVPAASSKSSSRVAVPLGRPSEASLPRHGLLLMRTKYRNRAWMRVTERGTPALSPTAPGECPRDPFFGNAAKLRLSGASSSDIVHRAGFSSRWLGSDARFPEETTAGASQPVGLQSGLPSLSRKIGLSLLDMTVSRVHILFLDSELDATSPNRGGRCGAP